MAIKGIIVLPVTSRYSPAKIGDFIWTEQFGKHVFKGKSMALAEFNAASKMVFDDVETGLLDHQPYAQLVEVAEGPLSFDEINVVKSARTRHKPARRRRDIKLATA